MHGLSDSTFGPRTRASTVRARRIHSSESENSARSPPPDWMVAAQNRNMSALDAIPRRAWRLRSRIHFSLLSVMVHSFVFFGFFLSETTKSGTDGSSGVDEEEGDADGDDEDANETGTDVDRPTDSGAFRKESMSSDGTTAFSTSKKAR